MPGTTCISTKSWLKNTKSAILNSAGSGRQAGRGPACVVSSAVYGRLEPPSRKGREGTLPEGRRQPPLQTPWICRHRSRDSVAQKTGLGFSHEAKSEACSPPRQGLVCPVCPETHTAARSRLLTGIAPPLRQPASAGAKEAQHGHTETSTACSTHLGALEPISSLLLMT